MYLAKLDIYYKLKKKKNSWFPDFFQKKVLSHVMSEILRCNIISTRQSARA